MKLPFTTAILLCLAASAVCEGLRVGTVTRVTGRAAYKHEESDWIPMTPAVCGRLDLRSGDQLKVEPGGIVELTRRGHVTPYTSVNSPHLLRVKLLPSEIRDQEKVRGTAHSAAKNKGSARVTWPAAHAHVSVDMFEVFPSGSGNDTSIGLRIENLQGDLIFRGPVPKTNLGGYSSSKLRQALKSHRSETLLLLLDADSKPIQFDVLPATSDSKLSRLQVRAEHDETYEASLDLIRALVENKQWTLAWAYARRAGPPFEDIASDLADAGYAPLKSK